VKTLHNHRHLIQRFFIISGFVGMKISRPFLSTGNSRALTPAKKLKVFWLCFLPKYTLSYKYATRRLGGSVILFLITAESEKKPAYQQIRIFLALIPGYFSWVFRRLCLPNLTRSAGSIADITNI
jgi:hypothetical protein